MRVAILTVGWTGYNDAACRLLAERGVEILAVFEGADHDTAYATHTVHDYASVHLWQGAPAPGEVEGALAQFRPDAVLMHSWHHPPYRAAVKSLPAGTLRVLWMDNLWRSTVRQWVGRAVAPVWVKPLFDAVMVPGDRTEFFARRLGFGPADVIRGSLSADTTVFGSPARTGAELASHRRFLACLRLVHHKGADVLADAYRLYRTMVDEPWDLQVAGLGEMAAELEAVDGVELLGFRQPGEVADLMRQASALVVPSRIDPFGVVVHEGAVSGLPVVTTDLVGAGPSYVQDGQNGWIVPSDDARALAVAMVRMSTAGADRLETMSATSRALGSRMSSAGWAQNVHEQLQWRLAALRAAP